MQSAPKILRQPVEIPRELIQHQNNYHDVMRRRRARIRSWWAKRVNQISDDWEYTDYPCDCLGAEEHPHNKVKFKKGDKTYTACPVSYWLVLKRFHEDCDNTNTLYMLLGEAECKKDQVEHS